MSAKPVDRGVTDFSLNTGIIMARLLLGVIIFALGALSGPYLKSQFQGDKKIVAEQNAPKGKKFAKPKLKKSGNVLAQENKTEQKEIEEGSASKTVEAKSTSIAMAAKSARQSPTTRASSPVKRSKPRPSLEKGQAYDSASYEDLRLDLQ